MRPRRTGRSRARSRARPRPRRSRSPTSLNRCSASSSRPVPISVGVVAVASGGKCSFPPRTRPGSEVRPYFVLSPIPSPDQQDFLRQGPWGHRRRASNHTRVGGSRSAGRYPEQVTLLPILLRFGTFSIMSRPALDDHDSGQCPSAPARTRAFRQPRQIIRGRPARDPGYRSRHDSSERWLRVKNENKGGVAAHHRATPRWYAAVMVSGPRSSEGSLRINDED